MRRSRASRLVRVGRQPTARSTKGCLHSGSRALECHGDLVGIEIPARRMHPQQSSASGPPRPVPRTSRRSGTPRARCSRRSRSSEGAPGTQGSGCLPSVWFLLTNRYSDEAEQPAKSAIWEHTPAQSWEAPPERADCDEEPPPEREHARESQRCGVADDLLAILHLHRRAHILRVDLEKRTGELFAVRGLPLLPRLRSRSLQLNLHTPKRRASRPHVSTSSKREPDTKGSKGGPDERPLLCLHNRGAGDRYRHHGEQNFERSKWVAHGTSPRCPDPTITLRPH